MSFPALLAVKDARSTALLDTGCSVATAHYITQSRESRVWLDYCFSARLNAFKMSG